MKLRQGFVSNSSSSSFVIGLDAISANQLKQIISHKTVCKRYGLGCDDYDEWHITVNEDTVEGYTMQDNFDMSRFLDMIGVQEKYITWGDF